MNQDTPFQKLQAAFDATLRKAQLSHDKLSAAAASLVHSAVAPKDIYDFGYCADVSVFFEAADEQLMPSLLAAYPSEDLVLVLDGSLSQKPVAYLREEEQRATLLPLAPVICKQPKSGASELIWWTRLSSGQMAQVHVRNASAGDFAKVAVPELYDRDAHGYSTGSTLYAIRKLSTPEVRQTALQSWLAAWDEFKQQEEYTGGQHQYLKLLRSTILRGARSDFDWTQAGLPTPMGPQPGTAMAIPPGRDLVEYLEEVQAKAAAREPHWLDCYGDFWRYFDRESAERMWQFVLKQNALWPDVQRADAQDAATFASALERLLSAGRLSRSFGASKHDDLVRKYLSHAVQAQTGLQATWHIASTHGDGRLDIEVRFSNSPDLAMHRVTIQAASDKTLRPQDIPVTYAQAQVQ